MLAETGTPSRAEARQEKGRLVNTGATYYALKFGTLYVAETNECRPSYVLTGNAILAAAKLKAPSDDMVGLIAKEIGVNAEDLRIVRLSIEVTEEPLESHDVRAAPAEGADPKEGEG